jgi:uncharacterized protein
MSQGGSPPRCRRFVRSWPKGGRNTAEEAPRVSPPQYKCQKCPGYCCSYPLIPLDKRDVERLARHHHLSYEDAKKAFTKEEHGRKYAMRRKRDPVFGKICRFFDITKRSCTIYEARPAVCRSFPGGGRCGYYDFLSFERRAQEDDKFIALTNHDD